MKRPNKSASRFSTWAVYALLFAYIVVSLAYQVVSSAAFVTTYFGLREQAHKPFELGPGNGVFLVSSTMAQAARAGLRVGDRIERVNGVPYNGLAQFQRAQWQARSGDVLRLGVRRPDGAFAALSIPFVVNANRFRVGEAALFVFIRVVIPLFCLVLGYWVALARPFDLNAWLVLLILSYPESFMSASVYQWWPGFWLVLRLYWHLILLILASLALFWLGLLFPQRSRIDVRLPWLKWCVLALLACGLGVALLLEYVAWFDLDLLANVAQIDAANNSVMLWTIAFCAIFYWIALFGRSRTALPADARRRLRVLRAGSVIGLGSMLIVFGGLPWFGIAHPADIRWLDILVTILMLAFPLSLAYVVIVQRAMDVRILVRTGTRYVLARTTLGLIEIAGAVLIIIFLVVPALEPQTRNALNLALSVLAVAVLIGLFGMRDSVSRRLQHWLDRKFFREAYNAELVLSELAGRVHSIADRSTLIDTVANRLSEVLHVPQVAALLRNQEVLRLQYAAGLPVDGPVSVPVPTMHNTSPVVLTEANRSNQIALDTMDPEVLLPLPGRSKLMGVLLLGSKLSEEPYSASDLRLLESVGVQTGLSLEVSELAHSLAQEAAHRERMQREIEIAREVQERLFPQTMPSLPGVDLAGNCRPAAGVGGDYYDLFTLDDGRLALVIGDISGKGISAALLMASLRASLRSIAEDHSDDLPRLMSKLNRQVYEASSANRYATFFFAVFEPVTRELRYVNAGHNAPFVLRGCAEPLRLETGGMVVGLLKEPPYLEGTVQLQPGDVFVGYTDGISEAMTVDGEEWGEQQLIAACTAARELSAGEMLQHVMNAADDFVQGAPQHDDMTLIVMKVG